jgi:L-rhamnose mutarotase
MSRRHVLMMNLRNDAAAIDAYRRFHVDVWPEVISSLRQAGIQRMEIHLHGRCAVMIVETHDSTDYRTAIATHAASNGRVAEWERRMKDLQEPAAGATGDARWVPMEPIFRMTEQEPAIVRVIEPARAS